jgi:protein SCO1
MKRAALAVLAALGAACGAPSRGPEAEPLARLPEFAMTAVLPEGERAFGLADLKGRVWVADFVYTSCGGPCPLMTNRMRALAGKLPPEIGLLTVTVDPVRDDAPRLREYARRHGADPRRWVFLRGDARSTYELVFAAFRSSMSSNPSAPEAERVTHSTRFALIDAAGALRGWYDGLSDLDNDALARDARRLLEADS